MAGHHGFSGCSVWMLSLDLASAYFFTSFSMHSISWYTKGFTQVVIVWVFFFLVRKICPELTSVLIFLYFICEMPPQHGWWVEAAHAWDPDLQTAAAKAEQSTQNFNHSATGQPLFTQVLTQNFRVSVDWRGKSLWVGGLSLHSI